MTPLQEMARKACMYKHCISDAKGLDGCCNRILAALDEAVKEERAACHRVVIDFIACIGRAFDEGRVTGDGAEFASGQGFGADRVAELIEERGA